MTTFESTTGKLKFIGFRFNWHMHEKTYDLDAARQIASECGLNAERISEIKLKAAFNKAKDEKSNGKERFWEKINETEDMLVIGEVVKLVVDNADLTYPQQSKAFFNKKTGAVTYEGENGQKLVDEYNKFQNVVTYSDVAKFLVGCVADAGGCKIKDNGGDYFVPLKSKGIYNGMCQFVQRTGFGKLNMTRVFEGDVELADGEVISGDNDRLCVWEAATREVEKRIAEVEARVEKINKKVGCAVKHTEDLEELQVWLTGYTSLCSDQGKVVEINNRIQQAMNKVAEKVASLKG